MAKKAENKTDGKIRIQYYRSSIGYAKKQKDIVRALGITKLNQTVEREDTRRCAASLRRSRTFSVSLINLRYLAETRKLFPRAINGYPRL